MRYRELGRTGLRVSEIGLGCEGFLNRDGAFTEELFSLALDAGVNVMDLYSPDPDMHRRVGRCLSPVRSRFVLQGHLCTAWKNGQYEAVRELDEVKRSFGGMLQNLITDYIDIGMIHYVDSLKTWELIKTNGILDYARELKEKGIIRAIGLSSHNPHVALAAVGEGIEVLMFSVNPCYDLLPGTENCEDLWADKSYEALLTGMDPDRKRLYELCEEKGAGITVMKAFGGGDLLSAEDSPAKYALTPAQCLGYALSRPAVGTVMAGVRSAEELRDVLSYETAPEAERDFASALAAFPRIRWEGHCMYCGHCAPCPAGIGVAEVMRFFTLAKNRPEIPETVREHYKALEHHASECLGCGACASRCPFGADAPRAMREAAALFGF